MNTAFFKRPLKRGLQGLSIIFNPLNHPCQGDERDGNGKTGEKSKTSPSPLLKGEGTKRKRETKIMQNDLKWKNTVVLLCLILLSALGTNVRAATIERANQVFYNYDKDISNIPKAIVLYEQIIKENRDPVVLSTAYTQIAMADLTMGDFADLTHTDALKDYEAGKLAAQKAIKLNPEGSDAYFWYAGNIGRMAQRENLIKALLSLPAFLTNLNKAYTLNPKSLFVLEAYAELYYQLPGAFGGSDEKSIQYIHEALKIDPRYTMPLTTLAKVYISEGRYAEARDVLNRVLQFNDPSYRAGWVMYDIPLAHKLLDSIKDKK